MSEDFNVVQAIDPVHIQINVKKAYTRFRRDTPLTGVGKNCATYNRAIGVSLRCLIH